MNETETARPKRRRRLIQAGIASALIAVGMLSGVAASAAANSTAASNPKYSSSNPGFHACVLQDGSSRLSNGAIYLNTAAHVGCPAGLAEFDWVKPTLTNIAAPPTTLKKVGGPWSPGHTVLATKQMPAGTYLITVTGDFYRAGDPGDCQALGATPVGQIQVNGLITEQLTAYTGAFPADPNETCGVDADGHPNGLEQTASASVIATIPEGGGQVELDAFAYNPDRSSSGTNYFGVIGHAQFELVAS